MNQDLFYGGIVLAFVAMGMFNPSILVVTVVGTVLGAVIASSWWNHE